MKPYNVEIFTQDFEMVGNTSISGIRHKEDYLSPDENTVTIFIIKGIKKQDYIRITRDKEEYCGVVTGVEYGTDKSKKMMVISYKPLMELFNTDILFDVSLQQKGSLEGLICDRIKEMFIENEDILQNLKGLSVKAVSETEGWYFHITPKDAGGHYNIVNLIDSVIIPAMKKYGIFVKAGLDIQGRAINVKVGRVSESILNIEADLPNIITKNIVIKNVSADINKLIIYDAVNYETKKTYYLHNDLSYDTKDKDRIIPVSCGMTSVSVEEGGSFATAAGSEAYNRFANLSYSNIIELTMMNGDTLVRPESLEFGQTVKIISDGVSYTSILTGREKGVFTKLIFGTVRLDLTKILRRNI